MSHLPPLFRTVINRQPLYDVFIVIHTSIYYKRFLYGGNDYDEHRNT